MLFGFVELCTWGSACCLLGMVWIVAVSGICGLDGSLKALGSVVQSRSSVVVIVRLLFYEVALYGDLYLPDAPLLLVVVSVS